MTAPRVTYLNHEHTVASWLLTKDHKRIAEATGRKFGSHLAFMQR